MSRGMSREIGAEENREGRPSGKRQPSLKERTLRAFEAYLELLDAAEWMRRELRDQLETFDLTIDGFRLLEVLFREGPMTTENFCERRRCTRQTAASLVAPLEERGWVRFEVVWLRPVDEGGSKSGVLVTGKSRRGRRMGMMSLTPAGEKFMRIIVPRHAKVVFAVMRALDLREQESLSKTCRKLRKGDVVKFLHEMSMAEDPRVGV